MLEVFALGTGQACSANVYHSSVRDLLHSRPCARMEQGIMGGSGGEATSLV